MKLIVGGAGQGMLDAALAGLPAGAPVADGAVCSTGEAAGAAVLDNLQELIRRELAAGRDPAETVEWIAARNPALVVVCQEIGCGIVPMDRAERDWRDQTGRICCALAKRAERVERVFCGISVVIKGEGR